MPAGITGSSTFSNTTQVPATGDNASQALFQTPFQRLLDNCKYLYDLITPFVATNKVIATYQGKVATYHTLGGSAVVTGTSVSVTNVLAGDVLLLDAWVSGLYTNVGGGSGGRVAIRVAGTAIDQSAALGTGLSAIPLMSRETPAAGTVACDVYFTSFGGAPGDFEVGTRLRVIHIRP